MTYDAIMRGLASASLHLQALESKAEVHAISFALAYLASNEDEVREALGEEG